MQRLAHRHRALERHVEIFRRIGAEANGTVVDQALGVHEAVLEGEAIDKWLQRRARRAHRAGHVDLPGAALVEIIG